MTTFRPRRRGIAYSEALAEAYASAPEQAIILHTLEFRHSSFIVNGVPVAPRVVNDHTKLEAYLEPGAPLNGGELVEFLPVRFSFSLPSESESGRSPEMTVTVDNVARILIPYLDLAKDSRDPIYMTWRPYLADDLTTPHMDPPITLTLRGISADMTTVSARAGFADLTNRRFPAQEYTSVDHPGLSAR